MFGAILLSLAMPAMPAAAATSAVFQDTPPAQDTPPIQVWLNKQDQIVSGERVRVYIRSGYDGHVIVLHADPEGRVRILYPLDPGGDDFVRGGTAYEVEGRQDGFSFRAVDSPGIGTVYVAYSQDPFDYERFVLNGHWDYRALELEVIGDAEDELTSVVQQMASVNGFDYDVADYYIASEAEYRPQYRRLYGGYGYWPSDYYYYDPYYYWPRYGYGSSLSFHIGIGSPYFAYYDPFYWDPFYSPYWSFGYRRYGLYWDPFWSGYYGGYYGRVNRYRYYNTPSIYIARPGQYYAVNNTRYTFKDRSGQPYRVDYRQRTVGGSTFASNVTSRRVAPEPRRVSSSATRRSAPGAQRTVATSARRVAPAQRSGTTGTVRAAPATRPGAVTTTRRAPSRAESPAATRSRPTPTRGAAETVRRRIADEPAATRSEPAGRRVQPAIRSRAATPRPTAENGPARRSTTTAPVPTDTRSAAPARRATSNPSTLRTTSAGTGSVRSRSAAPTRGVTATPRRSTTAGRPQAREAAPTRTTRPAARSSAPGARVSRPSSPTSGRSTPQPRVSRPTSSGRSVIRSSGSGSRPAARSSGSSSRPPAAQSSGSSAGRAPARSGSSGSSGSRRPARRP